MRPTLTLVLIPSHPPGMDGHSGVREREGGLKQLQAQHDHWSSTFSTRVEPPTALQDLGGPSLLETPDAADPSPSLCFLLPSDLLPQLEYLGLPLCSPPQFWGPHHSQLQIHTQLGPRPRVPDSPHGTQRYHPSTQEVPWICT